MFIKYCLGLTLLTALAASTTWAGVETHGGDDVGIEARMLLGNAVTDLQSMPTSQVDTETVKQLDALLPKITVIAVERVLYAELNGVPQESMAWNEPDAKMILVNRTRWFQQTDQLKKKAVMLHELFGIAGIESTGDYHLSSAYLASLGGGTVVDELVDQNLQATSFKDPTYNGFRFLGYDEGEDHRGQTYAQAAQKKRADAACRMFGYNHSTSSAVDSQKSEPVTVLDALSGSTREVLGKDHCEFPNCGFSYFTGMNDQTHTYYSLFNLIVCTKRQLP